MISSFYSAVLWLLQRCHSLAVVIGLDPSGSLGWALAIVVLVVSVRLLLVPSVLRQVAHQRKLRELQPEILALTSSHRGDRRELQAKVMQLHADKGINPLGAFSSTLWQLPIFFGLSHVLRHDVHLHHSLISTVVMVLLSSLCISVTQRMVLRRRPAPDNPTVAMTMRLMPYLIPLGVIVTSAVMPMGSLIYMSTTSAWTCGQTYWLARTGRL